MSAFPDALPHGPLEEVFPDVFYVKGQIRPTYGETQWQFTRSMTVVRHGNALTILNSIRLDDAGLAALDALGTVEHVVRLGSFHGRDDGFYVDRYDAPLWTLPGMELAEGLRSSRTLEPGAPGPVADGTTFVFESSKTPEAVLHLNRSGGILVTCDSLQNMLGPDEHFDEASSQMLRNGGFFGRGNLGPGWIRAASPQKADFDRLLQLQFSHLLSGHGDPLRDEAQAVIRQSVAATFA